MRRLLCIFFVIVVCLLSIISLAQSEIIFRPGPGLNDGTDNGSVNGGKDSWVYGNTSDTNYGVDPYVIGSPVSNCNPATSKAYIQFDLSTLPANVQQVFLGVTHLPHTSYCYSNCDADFYFYRLTESWNETTLTYGSAPSEAAAVYGPINIAFPNDFGNREYDITNIYRNWKDNSAPNHGLAIYSPTIGCNNASVIFYAHSSDASDENNRPYLRILPACVAPPSGLVSWWGGDNNPLDVAGTNHGTMVNGATFAPGLVGQAFSLDGVDDYVNIPYSADLDLQGAFSIEAWVRPLSFGPGTTLVAGKAGGYQLFVHADGRANVSFYDASDTWAALDSLSTLPLDAWSHLAATFDPTTDVLTLYINGQQDANLSTTLMPLANSNSLEIGGFSCCGSFFHGLIDEVNIYNRALASGEIVSTYNAGSAGNCRACSAPPSGLVSWWNGDGNANDIVGTNNGSLINGTSFASGKAGQAFSLDGVDDYVEIPHSESLNFGPTQPMSINLWVKRTSTSPVSTIFAKRPDCGAQVHYLLQWYEPGNWFVFGSTGAPANGVMTTADKLPLNTWTFISVAFDGSTVTMYINGTPVASHAMSFDPNTVPLTLGGEPSCGDFFGGLIDEIQIFNRALAAEEIAAIYNADGGGTCFTENFTLTVTKAGTGTGSVTPSTGALTWNSNTGTGIYSSGTLVTLTATADLGSVFEGWNGAGCSGTGDCIFTMTADTTVTVSFVPEILPLTPTEGTIGTELTVNGSGFGIKKGKVFIGGVATKIAKDGWKPDSITFTVTKVPLPAGVAYDVAIMSKEVGTITLPKAFTLKLPEIDSLDFYHGVAGVSSITITGNFFSTKKGKVYFEDISSGKKKNCKVTSWGMNSITFVVPKGLVSGVAYPLKVTNKVGIAEAPSDFTID